MSSRILFVDPSLGVEAGHHLVVARNYAELCKDYGRELAFVGNKRADAATRAALPNFAGMFSHTTTDALRVAHHGKAWMAHEPLVKLARSVRPILPHATSSPPRERAVVFSPERVASVFAPLGAASALAQVTARFAPGAGDHLVFLNVDPATIAAMHGAPAWRAPQANLHLLFMYPEPEAVGDAVRDGLLALYRDVFASPAFHLYAETPAHAAWLAWNLARSAPEHMPSPTRLEPLASPNGEINVAMLGAGRRDKGFALAPDIAAAAPHLPFRIQRAQPNSGLADIERRLDALSNVTLLPASISDAAFEAELIRAHIVLLPYDAQVFAKRGSGVLADALLGGRPFVCTRGSALEGYVRNGNGLAASTPTEFAEALKTIAASYPKFLAAARAHAQNRIKAMRHGSLLKVLQT